MAIVYFIIIMAVHSAMNGLAEGVKHINYVEFGNDSVVGLSLILFAFCCQPNVFEVYTELREPTVPYMSKVGCVSMSCCVVLYLIAGFFGYAEFGSRVHGAVLANYDPDANTAIFIAYLCLTVKLTAAFALCTAPTRDSVLYILGWGSYHTVSTAKRVLVSFIIALLALGCGIFIPSLEIFFGFLGGVCGSMLGFVLPALFVMYSGSWTLSDVGPLDYFGSWFLLVFGIVAFVFGTGGSIYAAVTQA
jgi:amino acid permease